MPDRKRGSKSSEAGFSLIELLCAMSVTLALASIASALLGSSLNIRTRENARTDSIADVQRALNIMTRELAIGGYGFDTNANGLVVGDSDASSIRVRSNLDRYSPSATDATRYTTTEPNEDLKYFIDQTNGQNFLVRYDKNAPAGLQSTVLANRVDSLNIVYWGPANTQLDPSQAANAVGLRITVSVTLPAVGMPGSPGYQPATTIDLSSDVALRNKSENLSTF